MIFPGLWTPADRDEWYTISLGGVSSMVEQRFRKPPVLRSSRRRRAITRAGALRTAFRTVRREVWQRRELELRYVTDLGANWTIA